MTCRYVILGLPAPTSTVPRHDIRFHLFPLDSSLRETYHAALRLWLRRHFANLDLRAIADLWTTCRLENKACIETYDTSALSTHGDVYLISTYKNSTNSLLGSVPNLYPKILGRGERTRWFCEMARPSRPRVDCDVSKIIRSPQEWSVNGVCFS